MAAPPKSKLIKAQNQRKHLQTHLLAPIPPRSQPIPPPHRSQRTIPRDPLPPQYLIPAANLPHTDCLSQRDHPPNIRALHSPPHPRPHHHRHQNPTAVPKLQDPYPAPPTASQPPTLRPRCPRLSPRSLRPQPMLGPMRELRRHGRHGGGRRRRVGFRRARGRKAGRGDGITVTAGPTGHESRKGKRTRSGNGLPRQRAAVSTLGREKGMSRHHGPRSQRRPFPQNHSQQMRFGSIMTQ